MKFVMDERVKHRLTGLVVVLSIAAIFVPAMMKKSSHHFEENVSLSIRLPAKPALPNVGMTDEKTLFQSVKVAHVNIPPAVIVSPPPSQIAKAEPLNTKSFVPSTTLARKEVVLPNSQLVVVPVIRQAVNTTPKVVQSAAIKKALYAVQLASFTRQENAKSLVSQLRSKGYIASYNKFSGKQGEFYQVVVGQLNQKDEAINLQKKLFIIKYLILH